MDERTLGEGGGGDTPFGNPNGATEAKPPDLTDFSALESVLDVDEVLSQARRVEKTVKICLRGDLQAEYDEALEELGGLVDPEGNTLSEGEQSLADGARANQLVERMNALQKEMAGYVRKIRFRALPEDEYREFDAAQRDGDGKYSDAALSNKRLIAKCAISPELTIDQVNKMAKTLGATQITAMANAAWDANNSGGLDIPKSLPFSVVPKRGQSGRS